MELFFALALIFAAVVALVLVLERVAWDALDPTCGRTSDTVQRIEIKPARAE